MSQIQFTPALAAFQGRPGGWPGFPNFTDPTRVFLASPLTVKWPGGTVVYIPSASGFPIPQNAQSQGGTFYVTASDIGLTGTLTVFIDSDPSIRWAQAGPTFVCLGVVQLYKTPTGGSLRSFNFSIDGGGSVISTGAKGQITVPVNCTVQQWILTADQSGSAVVDVLSCSFANFPSTVSIANTDKPTLASAQKNQNQGPLTGWSSTALNQGDQLQVNVNSIATITRLNLTLLVSVP